jgi:hypothetical protein
LCYISLYLKVQIIKRIVVSLLRTRDFSYKLNFSFLNIEYYNKNNIMSWNCLLGTKHEISTTLRFPNIEWYGNNFVVNSLEKSKDFIFLYRKQSPECNVFGLRIMKIKNRNPRITCKWRSGHRPKYWELVNLPNPVYNHFHHYCTHNMTLFKYIYSDELHWDYFYLFIFFFFCFSTKIVYFLIFWFLYLFIISLPRDHFVSRLWSF